MSNLPVKREHLNVMKQQLDNRIGEYLKVLPDHVKPQQLVRGALLALQGSPQPVSYTHLTLPTILLV